MNTQAKILFSSLALALAVGTYGTVHAAQSNQGSSQGVSPQSQSQLPSSNAGSTSSSNQQSNSSSQANTGSSASGTSASTGAQQNNNPILNMKAGEISGRQVYNTEGKELGKVDMIGRDRVTGDLNAIVSVGGFLGFGGSKVAIPVDQLSLQNNKLVLSTAMTKKELRQQASAYQSKHYEALADDTTLNQVAPAATASGSTGNTGASSGMAGSSPQAQNAPQLSGQATFQSLDINNDGYISRQEAAKDQALLNRWNQVDSNRDGKIDSVEFSAFEATSEDRSGGSSMNQSQGAQSMPRDNQGQNQNQYQR